MNRKIWIILIVAIIIFIILFSKIITNKNKSAEIKNINEINYMKIESDIFTNNSNIPAQYTCDGKSASIPLKISDVPQNAKSLALIVDDPDAPGGDFVHWVIWNIPPNIFIIDSGNIPSGAIEGYTSLNKSGWVAPCPPSGIHHYNFKLYALDILLSLEKSSTKKDLLYAMNEHIIENNILVGLYER